MPQTWSLRVSEVQIKESFNSSEKLYGALKVKSLESRTTEAFEI